MKHHDPKVVTPRTTTLSLPSTRAEVDAAEIQEKDNIPDLKSLLAYNLKLPSDVIKIVSDSSVSYMKMDTSSKPRVEYCVIVRETLDSQSHFRRSVRETAI